MKNYRPFQQNYFENELSLKDIIEFLQGSWKIITILTAFGIVCATLFPLSIPDRYETIAQIKLAQMADINSNKINVGTFIEDPQALIARMRVPSSYPNETIVLCGLNNTKDAEALLVSKVNFSLPNGGPSGVVDLRIRDDSKEVALACTKAILNLIKLSQLELINPFIEEARRQLKIAEERIIKANSIIIKSDTSGATVTAAYLSTRDEIHYLLDKISNLQSFISSSEILTARLTAPIFVQKQSTMSRKKLLLIGFLLGGMFGLLIALVRKWYRSNFILKH